MHREGARVASSRRRRAEAEAPKVDPSLQPVGVLGEKSIDMWIVNTMEICVEGSVSEVLSVVVSSHPEAAVRERRILGLRPLPRAQSHQDRPARRTAVPQSLLHPRIPRQSPPQNHHQVLQRKGQRHRQAAPLLLHQEQVESG